MKYLFDKSVLPSKKRCDSRELEYFGALYKGLTYYR